MASRTISMLSSFGPLVRGVSPYSDGLADALEKIPDVILEKFDYEKAYPNAIYPTSGNQDTLNKLPKVHYARPGSWKLPVANNPDLLHVQYWTPILSPTLLGVINAAKKKSVPTILTLHNVTQHERIPLLSHLEKMLLKRVDHIIVHTEQGKETLCHSLGFSETKVSCIPHGINRLDENISTASEDSDYPIAKLSENCNYLLYFGNIRHYKGVDTLIAAWERIYKNHPDTKLIIAGRCWNGKSFISRLTSKILGSEKSSRQILEKSAYGEAYNIIYRLGFIEEQQLQATIRIAKYIIFPYRKFNAQSGAAAKACSEGIPIITSNQGGLPLLAIDDTFVHNAESIHDLANTIDSKLKAWSPELRERQKSKIEPFFWENVATMHSSLYNQIINSNTP